MIQHNPNQRITLSEALQHNYFKQFVDENAARSELLAAIDRRSILDNGFVKE